MKTFIKRLLLTTIGLFVILQISNGSVSLPEIFSDNMVLQQKSDVILWGWAKTGETVIIKADWLDKDITTRASTQGTWRITLKTPGAGGPYNIHIKGYNEMILRNVLILEVWLCSGQSNMEMSAQSGINNGDEEIKNANYPEIRFFTVGTATSLYPQDHLAGKWTVCTPAESWMPEEVIQKDDVLREAAAKQKHVPWGPVEPARIYNDMITQLIPSRIAGVLWYQGEANT